MKNVYLPVKELAVFDLTHLCSSYLNSVFLSKYVHTKATKRTV